MSQQQGPPPPGWYPDSPETLRWWDGRQWTEYRQTRANFGSTQPSLPGSQQPTHPSYVAPSLETA